MIFVHEVHEIAGGRMEEFDDAFDRWLKERFKPFRDKQRPTDYGKDLAPDSEKTAYTQVFAFSPTASIAATAQASSLSLVSPVTPSAPRIVLS